MGPRGDARQSRSSAEVWKYLVLDRLAVPVELEVKLPSPIKALHEYNRVFYSLVGGGVTHDEAWSAG